MVAVDQRSKKKSEVVWGWWKLKIKICEIEWVAVCGGQRLTMMSRMGAVVTCLELKVLT